MKLSRHIITTFFLASALSLTLTSCSSKPEKPNLWQASEQIVIQESFQHINDFYVHEIKLSALALSGLKAILEKDPAYSISFDDQNLTLQGNDEHIISIPFELQDLKFPAAWAKASYKIMTEAQRNSSILKKINSNTQLTIYIRAALEELDKFSRYSDPDEALTIQQTRDGFGGIGVALVKQNNKIKIETVEENSPAYTVNIQPNDTLLEIDDILLDGLGISEVQTLLRGPVNRPVKIMLKRETTSDAPFSHVLIRNQITTNTVTYDANLLYPRIEIKNFNKRTSKRLAEAIARAKEYSGSQLKGIILDIRGNPGGLLQEAIDSADLLIDRGILSQTKGRNPLSFQQFEAEPGNILGTTPMVVLIDGATASAAEILAAALQDHQRAVIVGSISYGKGTVQNLLHLSNHAELALTWAYYLAPDNYLLQGYGILPNICTENQENGIAAVLKTLRAHPDEARKSFQKMRTAQFKIKKSKSDDVEDFRNKCLWQGEGDQRQDREMEAAKTLLSNPELYDDALSIAYLSADS